MSVRTPLKDRIADRIAGAKDDVFVPGDFADFSDYDQILRALRQLVTDGALAKIGYGVYARLEESIIDGSRVLTASFADAVRQALRKLEVPFSETDVVEDYNAGRTTQIQSNAVFYVNDRFSRSISFRGQTARIIVKKVDSK